MTVRIQIRVVPNARRTFVEGLMEDGETWRVRLKAPPVDGKANKELLRGLAEVLGVRRNAIQLESGEKSRDKRVVVLGLPGDVVRARLQAPSAPAGPLVADRDRENHDG